MTEAIAFLAGAIFTLVLVSTSPKGLNLMDWITAHAKALIVALGAVLVLVVDQETADKIVGAATVLLTLLVPNDQAAVDRIYHRRDRR